MKIAVIGGGIAGLTAAWLLGRQHQVTLYERQARPGFVASSVAVPGLGAGAKVDVPLRVFYAGYYPTLVRLYEQLGVDTEPVSYATSFMGDEGRLFFRWRNLQWAERSLGYVLPQDLAGARARRIVAGLLRFYREARAALLQGELAQLSIGDYVAAQRYSADFVDGFLLPAIATVCTCSYSAARAFPAAVIVDYLARGLARESVRRARHGADDVAQKLLAGIAELHCDAAVRGVRRVPEGVQVALADGNSARYDHVVLAAQANQSRAMWLDATPHEAGVLDAFRYQPVSVVMHTDLRLMPQRRADWSPVNALVSPQHEHPMSTIWVNAVQPALRHAPALFQTVHPVRPPREECVIARAQFERPLVDAATAQALQRLGQMHTEPGRRVWLCGSYAQPGIPLLESAVASAYAAAAALNKA